MCLGLGLKNLAAVISLLSSIGPVATRSSQSAPVSLWAANASLLPLSSPSARSFPKHILLFHITAFFHCGLFFSHHVLNYLLGTTFCHFLSRPLLHFFPPDGNKTLVLSRNGGSHLRSSYRLSLNPSFQGFPGRGGGVLHLQRPLNAAARI